MGAVYIRWLFNKGDKVMYAIIQIAGKQFKVKPGMVLNVPTLDVE
ncbi:MAG: hypothetical protein HON27_08405, partial [Candidatus Marinimicrobia bacterium]|nr:hypothetical protein [Candidatus Neomarinimicrobiota bacterium]